MSTIVSCKHCGVEIVPGIISGTWDEKEPDAGKRIDTLKYCSTGSGQIWQLHEPFVPEDNDVDDWWKEMHYMLNILKEGNEDSINIKACEMFLNPEGTPKRAQINEFEAFAPCKISPKWTDNFGRWIRIRIAYNGKTFMFG